MKTVIIIGFDYRGTKTLPGIPIDLYYVYNTILKIKPDKVKVITDIVSDYDPLELIEAIIDEIANNDIYNFIKVLKERRQYELYNSLESFKNIIKETINESDQIFFYYSGHSKNGDLLLPSIQNGWSGSLNHSNKDDSYNHLSRNGCSSRVGINEIKQLVIDGSKTNSDIFFVFDCCDFTGLDLPFILRKGRFYLNRDCNVNEHTFNTQNILCIGSTLPHEISGATGKGSLFTSSLCKLLVIGERSLDKVSTIVGENVSKFNKQTITITSSKSDIKLVPSWIYGLSVDLYVDHINKTLSIRHWN